MLSRNPKIEEDLDKINLRIINGEEAVKAAEGSEKDRYARAVENLKRKRRIMNKAFQVQLALTGHIFEPEKAFEMVQLFQHYCQEHFYEGKEDIFLEAEKRVDKKPLLEKYDLFGVDYDYENLSAFYGDVQELLILTLEYILAVDKGVSRHKSTAPDKK